MTGFNFHSMDVIVPGLAQRGVRDLPAGLCSENWAWEFLRRNPNFRRDWAASRPEPCTSRRIRVDHFLHQRYLARWGCSFADPPVFDAVTARVVWMPEFAPALDVYTTTKRVVPQDAVFDFARLQVSITIVESGPLTHFILFDAGKSLQLCLSRGRRQKDACLMTPALVPPNRLQKHLLLISRLNDLCQHGKLRPHLYPIDNRSRRLSHVLSALDGRLAGRTDREIAISLFGNARVSADWSDPGGWLRDRVRRAVRRGLHLMNGGYLQLLR